MCSSGVLVMGARKYATPLALLSILKEAELRPPAKDSSESCESGGLLLVFRNLDTRGNVTFGPFAGLAS